MDINIDQISQERLQEIETLVAKKMELLLIEKEFSESLTNSYIMRNLCEVAQNSNEVAVIGMAFGHFLGKN